MARIYLSEIRFSNKDAAKEVARKNGTRISWEPEKKMWYWEGEGQLPECLKQFSYDTSPEGYRTREKSFNKFLASDAGARWEEKNERIMASELGQTVEEYRAEEAAHKERLDRESDKYRQSDEYKRLNEEIERELGMRK